MYVVLENIPYDDDNDYYDNVVFIEWSTDERRILILIPAGTIVRDSHHHKSLTCRKQNLNLCIT